MAKDVEIMEDGKDLILMLFGGFPLTLKEAATFLKEFQEAYDEATVESAPKEENQLVSLISCDCGNTTFHVVVDKEDSFITGYLCAVCKTQQEVE